MKALALSLALMIAPIQAVKAAEASYLAVAGIIGTYVVYSGAYALGLTTAVPVASTVASFENYREVYIQATADAQVALAGGEVTAVLNFAISDIRKKVKDSSIMTDEQIIEVLSGIKIQ